MDRIGGRIWTTEKDAFGYSIDLGPSIVTGKQGNPVTTLCKQLDMEMRGVRVKAPLYSPDGEVVSDAVDEAIEIYESFDNLFVLCCLWFNLSYVRRLSMHCSA